MRRLDVVRVAMRSVCELEGKGAWEGQLERTVHCVAAGPFRFCPKLELQV